MDNMNRLFNCSNPYQGKSKRVLCVCSAGLLRSPTTARLLAEQYSYNTRAVGLDVSHALIPVDEVLLSWADEVVCMDKEQMTRLFQLYEDHQIAPPQIVCLDVPDSYGYMDKTLVTIITDRYKESLNV